MKRFSISILILAMAATGSMAQKLDRSMRPTAGPAPEIKLGKTESFTLPNGMRVFVVENHNLPAITVSIQLDVKPELQGDMNGMQDQMSELLTSGTKTRSKEKLNESIDVIGARVRADENSIFGNCLTKHENELLDLMSDIMMNSDFKQEELDRLKKQTLSEMESQKNNPDAMLANVTAAINFGKTHPYGEVATDATVKNITLEAYRNYYHTYFRPNVAYMAIVGDVTVAQIKPLIEKYFGKWEKANVPVAKYPTPKPNSTTTVSLAPRDAAVQSVVNVTYPIYLQPGAPDVIKAKVANTLLGGGSQGRLFLNLREKHGWTYGSYSTMKEDELVGSFTGYAKCRNAVTDSSIEELLKEMHRMGDEQVSAAELKNSLTYMTGSFAIGLENPQVVAQYAINLERYHMPKDYYTNYLKNLNAVTAADVQEMAKKYITPNNANIIVVGSDEMATKLAKFGPVALYDNYGNPKAAKAAATAVPAGITADAVMKKYVAALGGEKAISSVKDLKVVRTATAQGMAITITELKKDNKYELKVEGNNMTFQKMVFTGDKGFQEAFGQHEDMKKEDIEEAREQADLQQPLHPEKYGRMEVKGIEKINGVDAYAVETTDAQNKKGTKYYDVNTGLLIRSKSVKPTPQGEITVMLDFSDYKEVPGANGYKLPYTMTQMPQNIAAAIQTVAVNKGIADSEFQ